jgi:hypothetical protein
MHVTTRRNWSSCSECRAAIGRRVLTRSLLRASILVEECSVFWDRASVTGMDRSKIIHSVKHMLCGNMMLSSSLNAITKHCFVVPWVAYISLSIRTAILHLTPKVTYITRAPSFYAEAQAEATLRCFLYRITIYHIHRSLRNRSGSITYIVRLYAR